MTYPNIIVALDCPTARDAMALADQLDPAHCRLKIGKALFTQCGPSVVKSLIKNGFDVFLDLKYHDIPNTVAHACLAAAELGVWMVNVHALGGDAMMIAARKVLCDNINRPLIVAVTLLTSMDDATFKAIGFQGSITNMVLSLAKSASDCGLDGVVCSAMEARQLRAVHGDKLKLITPGIRPSLSYHDDQHRTMTPIDAIHAGSNYLVIGRPITGAKDPMQTLLTIEQSLLF